MKKPWVEAKNDKKARGLPPLLTLVEHMVSARLLRTHSRCVGGEVFTHRQGFLLLNVYPQAYSSWEGFTIDSTQASRAE